MTSATAATCFDCLGEDPDCARCAARLQPAVPPVPPPPDDEHAPPPSTNGSAGHLPPGHEQATRPLEARPVELPAFVRLDRFLAEPDPEVTYRVDRLWPAGGRVLLAAQYKAGKSTVVGNILRSLADGDDLFGTYPVTVPEGRIVLIDDELHRDTLRRWLRQQGVRQQDRVDVVPIRGQLSSFDLLDDRTRDAWARRIQDAGADVLILDCLRPVLDALGLSEDKDAGRFLVAFDTLLHDADVDEGLGIHHMGHAGERSRGDSRLRDWPDAEWRIVRDKDDQDDQDNPAGPRFFSAYGRDVDEPEQQLALDPDGRRLTIVGGSRRESRTQTAITAVVEAVTTTPGVNSTDLRKAVREVTGGQAPEVDKARDAALKQGLIRTETGARGARLHYLADAPEQLSVSTVSDPVPDTVDTVSGPACPMSLEDTDTVTTPVGTREQPSARPDTDTVEPAPLPPCTVCGEPTRDRKRQVHQRCLTEEPS